MLAFLRMKSVLKRRLSYFIPSLQKVSIGVVVAWASAFSIAWGGEISPPGKWIFGLQSGVAIMARDVGNGNGAVTQGEASSVWNERLLYRVTDSVALGIHLEWEEHDIKNTSPVVLDFGQSSTLSSMVVIEVYPPLWPTFASFLNPYPLFPYGLIGVGQNSNAFTESSTFTKNCNPSSACTVSLENTLAIKIAAGVDYLVAPNLSINAEVGWKLNSGESRISTTNAGGTITISPDSYQASTASVVVGMRYFFERPKPLPPLSTQAATPQRRYKPVPMLEPTIVPQALWMTKALLFESRSWAISDEGKALLLEVSAALKTSPQTPIQIEGHTDLHGSKEENRRIGQKRAEAVIEWLKEAGTTNEMRIISYGDSQPVSKDATPAADRLNRRVIIRRLGKPGQIPP